MLHWQHLPVPLRTFRDVHIPNHANIRVMDFHRLAGVFGPLHILLMHHDFLNMHAGSAARTTSDERPSVEGRLQDYRAQLEEQRRRAPARQKTKTRTKTR